MKWNDSRSTWRFDILIYASCDYVVFAVSAVCCCCTTRVPVWWVRSQGSQGYPRDRKDLKYLSICLSTCRHQSLYCWLRWLTALLIFEIWCSRSGFQCVLMSDDGCCTTHHHHHQAWLCTNMMMISRDMMQFLSIPTLRKTLLSF